MKIAGYNAGSVAPASVVDRAEASSPAARVSGQGALRLSATAQLILDARQALRGVPEVREPMVREFGARMSSGRYQPDPRAIAAAMISD